MDAFHLTPGNVFAGQYRVIRPLAAGGMGAVYVVEQLSTGKQRALKLMLPLAIADGERRFAQEARTSSLIPSEHVVDVIDAGVDDDTGVPWLAMELLSGESLEHYLERRGYLAAPEVFDILQQLCHALVAAHDLGVVHRDLKPDNLFLSKSRTGMSSSFLVKVLDFGLAKVVDRASRNTAAMGTPLWMAPEQTEVDAPISCAADVWALGLIAFRMLAGAPYWRSAQLGLQPLLRELLIDPLEPASVRASEVGQAELPVGFDAWFARAVAREPSERFQHAREAWLELAPLLSRGMPASVPPISAQSLPASGASAAAALVMGETTAINAIAKGSGSVVSAISEPPIQTLRGVVGAAAAAQTPAAPPSRVRLFAALAVSALATASVGGYFVLRSGGGHGDSPRAGSTSPAVTELAPLPTPTTHVPSVATSEPAQPAPSADGVASAAPAEAPPPTPNDLAAKAARPGKAKVKPSAPSASPPAAASVETLPDLL
jgi:serine/threonine-protein kinase